MNESFPKKLGLKILNSILSKVNAGNGEQSGNGEQMLQFVTKNIYGGCNMMNV